MNGLIFILSRSNFPRPFSTTWGKESNLRVWPVGAVSNTTAEKFMPFTSLKVTNSTNYTVPVLKHYVKMVRENVYIHVFLTSTMDDGKWQSTCLCFFFQIKQLPLPNGQELCGP